MWNNGFHLQRIFNMHKPLTKSKKFVAYLIANLGWKAILIYLLFQTKANYNYYSFTLILTLIVVIGFIQVGYILGQASLDKYIHMVEKNKKECTKKNVE